MKTKKNENQTFGSVALYIRYEDGDLDEMKKKEEILVKIGRASCRERV